MFVLINGKVYNSDDIPIMILFSQEEITNFKSQPNTIDVHCSFPSKWEKEKGQKWMQSHVKTIVFERNKVYRKNPPIINIPKNVVSDDVIKNLLQNSTKNTDDSATIVDVDVVNLEKEK